MNNSRRIQRLVVAQTVAPTCEPVTLDEQKAWSRVDIGDENALITALITSARGWCENYTLRQFIMATWRLSLDRFPVGDLNDATSPAIEGWDIILPRPNLLAVDSITYLDTDGVEQTLAPSTYVIGTDDLPGRIALAYNQDWPCTRRQLNAVKVTYRSGYSDNTIPGSETAEEKAIREAAARAAVPEEVRTAIKLMAAHHFENREPIVVGTIAAEIAFTMKALLNPKSVPEMW